MSTALREFWTDYRCGSDYDVRYCEGDSDQSCTFEQCVVVNGDTLATVTARIKAGAVTESKQVLHHLHQEDYQTVTKVHRALKCTSYYGDDGQCVYVAKLSELIETTQTVNFDEEFNVNDIVYWRFKVNGNAEKWQLWKTRRKTSAETGCKWSTCDAVYDDDDVLTFSDPETKISIEAWTQCGLVRIFFFFVHLHVNSAVDVCKHFGEIWYQTTVSRLPIATQMCAYPSSDFADLYWNIGEPHFGQDSKGDKDFPEIVTRFGVEMLHIPNTEAITNFEVSCDFTYVVYGNAVHKKTCGQSFSISDSCGGNIVRSTKTTTFVESGAKECCQGCAGAKVVCTAILDAPDSNADLMRCEPSGVYSNYYFPISLPAEATQNHPVVMMLLSGGVLAVAVTLVARSRRKTAVSSAQVDSDLYYPLLN
ncbi:hypothetical protein L916_20958 [Phytophthora nicotianae]|uniref:Uncharacterized protein n=1 Tax=Phytophthora nicotianae TaxID=4792 RepID=W2HTA1_PHYNI|nr:hypothetical protein L916_20958 [Phytophthora nicotianae]